MKTLMIAVWTTVAIAFTLGFPARAQNLGQCTQQVLSAPTEDSVRVRVTGVNQWPVNPICIWSTNGPRADGGIYRWTAALTGDGLVDNYVSAAVVFRYEVVSGPEGGACTSLALDCSCPYPSAGFTNRISSDNASLDPLCANNVPVSLSFRGTISLDAANNFTVDVTFKGGPPAPTIDELIAAVNGSSLSAREKRPLLATLEGARASLTADDCQTAINQLTAFQNKVRAQVRRSDPTLADALIADAQALIDAACSD